MPISDSQIELVERKGKGHPDSLIDGACEAVSGALCKYYQDNYDAVKENFEIALNQQTIEDYIYKNYLS